MSSYIKLLFMSVFVCLVNVSFASCGNHDGHANTATAGNVTITADPSAIKVHADGQTVTVSVAQDGKEWTAYETASWIKLKIEGSTRKAGTLAVTVSENESPQQREGSVVVRSGTSRLTIPVVQSGKMTVSVKEIETVSTQNTKTIVVNKSDFSVSADAQWLTATKEGNNIHLSVAQNTALTSRTGHVTIVSGMETIVVPVKQDSRPNEKVITPEGYTLVWNDEFNSNALGADWVHEVKPSGWVNNELQNYINDDKVVFLEDGKMNIHCYKDTDGKIYSGRVYAKPDTGWKYGYMEARILLPKGKGTWPAFWMMPVKFNSWPADGEIDIMEEVGVVPNEVSSSIHCTAYNHNIGTQKTNAMTIDSAEGEYHVYALEWTEDYIKTYVDGKPQLSFDNDKTGNKDTWPFNKEFYIIFNLAWGGAWGGMNGVDESALPVTMKVDYVRVFQKKN